MKFNVRATFGICCLVFILMLTGCGATANKPEASAGTAAKHTLEEQADKILAGMSLPEKVGQMVMIGINETSATEDNLFMLHQYHIGGIILYDLNMKSPEQVRELTSTLQREAGQKLPLFFAVDEEGGNVARMRDKLPPPPAAADVGATGKPELAEELAENIGNKLKEMGFNVNFAPVADLGSERGRSFSDDPYVVTDFLQSAAKGYEKAGMIFCLKHFPGIGKASVDPHFDTAVVDMSLSEMEQADLLPFKNIIEGNSSPNYMLMVSHITYPQLDAENPASLSKIIQTDILRNKLGFNGVVITDSVSMGALSKHYGYREIGVRAVEAGSDIVLINHDYPYETELYLGILDAAEKGQISEERINESVRRIIKMKLSH